MGIAYHMSYKQHKFISTLSFMICYAFLKLDGHVYFIKNEKKYIAIFKAIVRVIQKKIKYKIHMFILHKLKRKNIK